MRIAPLNGRTWLEPGDYGYDHRLDTYRNPTEHPEIAAFLARIVLCTAHGEQPAEALLPQLVHLDRRGDRIELAWCNITAHFAWVTHPTSGNGCGAGYVLVPSASDIPWRNVRPDGAIMVCT